MATRNTIQRKLVWEAVKKLHNHPTVDEIYKVVAEEHHNISKGTVYRNLNLLAENGYILKVEVPEAADRFDFNTKPHYHIYCKGCGQVFDIDMPYLNDIIMQNVHDTHGFIIEGHDIVFKGLCPECSQKG